MPASNVAFLSTAETEEHLVTCPDQPCAHTVEQLIAEREFAIRVGRQIIQTILTTGSSGSSGTTVVVGDQKYFVRVWRDQDARH